MRFRLLILVFFLLFAGCASSKDAKKIEGIEKYQSEEFKEVDTSIDELSAQTHETQAQYDELQSMVINRIDFGQNQNMEAATKLEIVINNNSVIVVNEVAMSRNAFMAHIEAQLPRLCNPSPSLTMHERADYETASWVLEQIYTHGCTNVELKQ